MSLWAFLCSYFITRQSYFLAVRIRTSNGFLYPKHTFWFQFNGNKSLHSLENFKLNFAQCASEHCYQMNYIRFDSWGIESKTKTVNCVNVFCNECQFNPRITCSQNSAYQHHWFKYIDCTALNFTHKIVECLMVIVYNMKPFVTSHFKHLNLLFCFQFSTVVTFYPNESFLSTSFSLSLHLSISIVIILWTKDFDTKLKQSKYSIDLTSIKRRKFRILIFGNVEERCHLEVKLLI